MVLIVMYGSQNVDIKPPIGCRCQPSQAKENDVNNLTLWQHDDCECGDNLYFEQSGTFTVESTITFGDYVKVTGMNMDDWGTVVHTGKHLKSVHPARRNKEKKKTRVEARISYGGQSATIVKVDSDTWMIEGTDIV